MLPGRYKPQHRSNTAGTNSIKGRLPKPASHPHHLQVSTYTSLEAELHDPFWESEDTPELKWLDALLTEFPGHALEVGCGSGRLLLPLLEKGHAVEGLEPSPDMLALCRAKARDLKPVLHAGSMASFQTQRRYRAILIPAFTLQLSPDPTADLRFLRTLLRRDGILYLTVFLPFAELDGELPENEWYPDHEIELPAGGRASLQTRHRLDLEQQLLHREHHYRVEQNGTIREHRSTQTIRWFEPKELAQLLADTGFRIDRALADFDESLPVTEDAQIITLVARPSGDLQGQKRPRKA